MIYIWGHGRHRGAARPLLALCVATNDSGCAHAGGTTEVKIYGGQQLIGGGARLMASHLIGESTLRVVLMGRRRNARKGRATTRGNRDSKKGYRVEKFFSTFLGPPLPPSLKGKSFPPLAAVRSFRSCASSPPPPIRPQNSNKIHDVFPHH
jgi:hypothetical protein